MQALAIASLYREEKRAAAPLAVIGDSGVFEGYASLFGQRDDSGDIVAPGAFVATLHKRGARGVKLLWQHMGTEPIGVWTKISEDARGLKVEGKLDLSVSRAREALSLMRSGAVDGLSIGFHAVRYTKDKATGGRRLLEVDLPEISVVTFPMLRSARIAKVKAAPVTIDDLILKLARLRYAQSAQRFEAKLLRPGVRAFGSQLEGSRSM